MLQLMRKHARNWLMKVILGIIIIVFIFYFGSMRGRKITETIAEIDGVRIAQAEFKREYQNLLDFYRQRYENNLTDEMLKKLNVKQQAFERLINQAVILSKADELKLDVSDEELKESILSYPAFQKNGAFDNNLYQWVLRHQRLTPEDFEAIQGRMLKIEKLEKLIKESAKVSDKEVRDIYDARNRKININFITISTDVVSTTNQPSEEELEKYLEEHGEAFRVPQKATIEYIVFKGESFATTEKISDEEIEDYYDYHENEFEDNGAIKPLSEVRDTIISRLRAIKGMDTAFREATKAHDAIYQEENFEEYAGKHALHIETSEFSRGAPLTSPLADLQDLNGYVFGLEEGDLGHVFSDSKGHYVFRLVSLNPSFIPALGEITDTVKKSFMASEFIKAARERASTILDRLKAGVDIVKLSREEGLEVSETGLFLPGSDIPEIGYSPELTEALLTMSEKNPFPDTVFFINGNYIVVAFKGEGAVNEKEWEAKKDSLKNYLLRLKQDQYFMSWLEGTKKNMADKKRLKILRRAEDL